MYIQGSTSNVLNCFKTLNMKIKPRQSTSGWEPARPLYSPPWWSSPSWTTPGGPRAGCRAFRQGWRTGTMSTRPSQMEIPGTRIRISSTWRRWVMYCVSGSSSHFTLQGNSNLENRITRLLVTSQRLNVFRNKK